MFADGARLFQHSNRNIADSATVLVVSLDQLGETYGTGQACRARTDKQNVHVDSFVVERLSQDQLVARQLWLEVPRRQPILAHLA
jgi:hypothetical protein